MSREHTSRPPQGALALLLDTWAERDDRYTNARIRLGEEEEAMVLQSRRAEAMRLAPDERMEALRVLSKWVPPAGRMAGETVSPSYRTDWGLRLVRAR